ncbi:symmetrical bis(5'-nucleosyl)-tetraphosphatase [Aquabacterium sp.]|uniref:symmetrical bis(5'-nucleosyl)-tetraphosphatase n=1 Tax=Aquabacterium sp. TaxID=1872578 RepID=UPI00248A1D29|nr:symmetrical bis(5'-nucleosyl)-tetraphosphatase [Aquabacterium sp.]MDI1258255.1 symmetrical bis(5'-nucleosyl)-tetraphosphatase [Aquabacterium sp.]
MIYLVGDLQGCCDPLERLLATIDFSPSRDRLYFLGDLVNRGPDSLGVLKRLRSLGDSAVCLLGNHDLHLLAVAHGVRKPHKNDTLDSILSARDRDDWLDWLRLQRLAVWEHGWLMVHAGVVPQWDADQTVALAGEVESMLRSPDIGDFLNVMYGAQPNRWQDDLQGPDRWRCIVNSLTRLRFCADDGTMEFATKDGAGEAPEGFSPWFELPGRRTADTPVAFGHWSTLGLINTDKLLSLDTGCVWGGQLSAVRIDGAQRELIQIDCPQAQKPGK